MVLESLIGTALGGAFRLAPELLKHFSDKDERAAELQRLRLEADIAREQAEAGFRAAELAGGMAIDLREMDATVEAIRGQHQPTGIKWVDAMSSTVRPVVTYWLLALYSTAKAAQYTLAVGAGAEWNAAALTVWSESDAAMLASVLSFWFLDRALRRKS